MGDFTGDLCKPPIANVSAEINNLVGAGQPDPRDLLEREFGSIAEDVPILLQLYMYQHAGEVAPAHLRLPLLAKHFDEICSSIPGAQGILLDGFPRTLEAAEEAEAYFGPGYAVTVINLQCSAKILRDRYLGRARPGDTEVNRFEKRIKSYERAAPSIANFYRARGILVEVSTEGTLEQAWSDLIDKLQKTPAWDVLVPVIQLHADDLDVVEDLSSLFNPRPLEQADDK